MHLARQSPKTNNLFIHWAPFIIIIIIIIIVIIIIIIIIIIINIIIIIIIMIINKHILGILSKRNWFYGAALI